MTNEEKLKELLRLFLDSIRAYEHEGSSRICDDDRISEEFVEIFINSEDAFYYKELANYSNSIEGEKVETSSRIVCTDAIDCDCERKHGFPRRDCVMSKEIKHKD